MSHELEIKLEKFVQFRLDQSVFTVGVDKHGRPHFPESVLEKVPPAMREVLKDIVLEFDSNQIHKRVYHLDADHQEWCAETKGLGTCNCDPVSVSCTSKKPIQQLEISIGDEYVELTYGESVFKLDLNQYGSPVFPESVKKELPPDIPGIVGGRIIRMRRDGRNQGQINLPILHDFWCEELAGIGMCSCDPILCDPAQSGLDQWGAGSWGPLTCVVCHESANGSMCSDGVMYDGEDLFVKHRIYGEERFYWEFSNKTLICEDCLRDIMSETGIRFPNVIDRASSPNRAVKPVLH